MQQRRAYTYEDLQTAMHPLAYFIQMLSHHLDVQAEYLQGKHVLFETATARLLGIQDNQQGAQFNVTGEREVNIEFTLNLHNQSNIEYLKNSVNTIFIKPLIMSVEKHPVHPSKCKIVMDARIVLEELLPILKKNLLPSIIRALYPESKIDLPSEAKVARTTKSIPASCPATIKCKRYSFRTCYDGKEGFEARRYPDEHLILQSIYATCAEAKIAPQTILLAGRSLDFARSLTFKDKVVLDSEQMFWDEKTGELDKPLDIIARCNFFAALQDKPKLYILVFHWGYHHGFFAADFQNNTFLYLDPQGILLSQRGAKTEYGNMEKLINTLKESKSTAIEYQGQRLQTDGNSCGPITGECVSQLIKRMISHHHEPMLPKSFLLDARFNIPKPEGTLASMKLRRLIQSNEMLGDPAGNLVNEISLIDEQMWNKIFIENKLTQTQTAECLDQLRANHYFKPVNEMTLEEGKKLIQIQKDVLRKVLGFFTNLSASRSVAFPAARGGDNQNAADKQPHHALKASSI